MEVSLPGLQIWRRGIFHPICHYVDLLWDSIAVHGTVNGTVYKKGSNWSSWKDVPNPKRSWVGDSDHVIPAFDLLQRDYVVGVVLLLLLLLLHPALGEL